ncbi:MAG: hypothetical protein M3O70_02525 [Actinomycetota bacterium]|nr:hypothetical protein [Actinomycetota bacterium]
MSEFKVGRSLHVKIPLGRATGCGTFMAGLMSSKTNSKAVVTGRLCGNQARCYHCGSLVLWPKLVAAKRLLDEAGTIYVTEPPISSTEWHFGLISDLRHRFTVRAGRFKRATGQDIGRITLVPCVPGCRDQPAGLYSFSTVPLPGRDWPTGDDFVVMPAREAWELLKSIAVVGEVAEKGFSFAGTWNAPEKPGGEYRWETDPADAEELIRYAGEWFAKFHPEWSVETILYEPGSIGVGDKVEVHWKGTGVSVCEHRWMPAWNTMMAERYKNWGVLK